MAGIPPADPNQYFTPTFDKDMPQGTATHFRQLYLASQQHDQAIKILHANANTTTTTVVHDVTSGSSGGVLPGDTPAVAHQFLISYSATSGMYGQAQPAFTDVGGNLTTSQLPTGLFSGTITTAKLTVGGANGSMTFVNGVLSSQVAAT